MDLIEGADRARRLRRIRIWLVVFIVGLVLSGATAFALETEPRDPAAAGPARHQGLGRRRAGHARKS